MRTTAGEFQAACKAGFVLAGQDDGEPVWIRTEEQFNHYKQLLNQNV